jgi:hypothetical protein
MCTLQVLASDEILSSDEPVSSSEEDEEEDDLGMSSFYKLLYLQIIQTQVIPYYLFKESRQFSINSVLKIDINPFKKSVV